LALELSNHGILPVDVHTDCTMIRNDEQLTVVREQLARVESALAALRRDVLPVNPRLYEVMSESYAATIQQLRAQIDEYLGIITVPRSADFVVALEGDCCT
jgi:hypothetical protein